MENRKDNFLKISLIILVVLISIITVFMWLQLLKPKRGAIMEYYRGPTFPMSFVSETEGIDVQREMKLDFTDCKYFITADGNDSKVVKINDQYTITNKANVERTLSLAYGFVGSYSSNRDIVPNVRIDGELADRKYVDLIVGRTFLRYGIENMEQYGLKSREEFELLLEDGKYMQDTMNAMKNIPVFSETVYVYKFKEVVYNGNDKSTQNVYGNVLYEMNPEKTTVYTYGFDEVDTEDGMNSISFFVPGVDGSPNYMADVYIIAVGEALDIQEIKYYSVTNPRHEIEGFSLELMEYETTFDAVLDEVVEENAKKDNPIAVIGGGIYAIMKKEQILKTTKQLIADMKGLENHSRESALMLEDFLYKSLKNLGMLYTTAEVTVPANGSVEVEFFYDKYMGIKKIDDTAYGGIEIMTSLGTNIEYTSQKLKVTGLDSSIISEHTTGEALENGSTEIILEDEVFEIYLKVPEK